MMFVWITLLLTDNYLLNYKITCMNYACICNFIKTAYSNK